MAIKKYPKFKKEIAFFKSENYGLKFNKSKDGIRDILSNPEHYLTPKNKCIKFSRYERNFFQSNPDICLRFMNLLRSKLR
jgi:hypothetical protein